VRVRVRGGVNTPHELVSLSSSNHNTEQSLDAALLSSIPCLPLFSRNPEDPFHTVNVRFTCQQQGLSESQTIARVSPATSHAMSHD